MYYPSSFESLSKTFLLRGSLLCSARKLYTRARILFSAYPFTFSRTRTAELSRSQPTRFSFHRWESTRPGLLQRAWLSHLWNEGCSWEWFRPRAADAAGDDAKAVISIGRPYKFAGGCSGERETSSSTKTIHVVLSCRKQRRGDTCWLPRRGI